MEWVGGVVILYVGSWWGLFTKPGRPGWISLIPIHNVFQAFEVARTLRWWAVLLLIPIVNVFVAMIFYISLAQNFGRGVGFALGLFFLGIVFLPILAFSSARYVGEPDGPGQIPPLGPPI